MTKRWSMLLAGGMVAVSMAALGCKNAGDGGNPLIPSAAAAQHDDSDNKKKSSSTSADSSPFVVGVWKFVLDSHGTPTIDSEFRFINPTTETLTLEYAFFELDGTFCGCDRDDFPPNKTTEYTILDETQLAPPLPNGPAVFSCKGTSGALKSIVFRHRQQHIFLDDATQIGFQTHAFGNIVEGDQAANLLGSVMTEAPLQGIALTDSTRDEIRSIHQLCNTVNGPL